MMRRYPPNLANLIAALGLGWNQGVQTRLMRQELRRREQQDVRREQDQGFKIYEQALQYKGEGNDQVAEQLLKIARSHNPQIPNELPSIQTLQQQKSQEMQQKYQVAKDFIDKTMPNAPEELKQSMIMQAVFKVRPMMMTDVNGQPVAAPVASVFNREAAAGRQQLGQDRLEGVDRRFYDSRIPMEGPDGQMYYGTPRRSGVGGQQDYGRLVTGSLPVGTCVDLMDRGLMQDNPKLRALASKDPTALIPNVTYYEKSVATGVGRGANSALYRQQRGLTPSQVKTQQEITESAEAPGQGVPAPAPGQVPPLPPKAETFHRATTGSEIGQQPIWRPQPPAPYWFFDPRRWIGQIPPPEYNLYFKPVPKKPGEPSPPPIVE